MPNCLWKGRANVAKQTTGFRVNEKRGVPRHHGNMPPGNSFPQICVVSICIIVDMVRIAQEYFCAMDQSNHSIN
jgi:hypothetical protein